MKESCEGPGDWHTLNLFGAKDTAFCHFSSFELADWQVEA